MLEHTSRLAEKVLRLQSKNMAKDNPERARRLAEALRENLRKRKAQGRERDDAPPSDDTSDDKAA